MATWREELLDHLVHWGCISPGSGGGVYKTHRDFTLSSGNQSKIYIDVKQAMCGFGMKDILAGIDEVMEDAGWWGEEDLDRWDGVAAMGMGGALLGGGLSARGYAVTMLREHPRDHGVVEQIVHSPEGHWGRNDYKACFADEGWEAPTPRIVLVDDVATTGRTLKKMRRILSTTQVDIVGALVVVDRNEGAREMMESCRIPYRWLVTKDEILKEAGRG